MRREIVQALALEIGKGLKFMFLHKGEQLFAHRFHASVIAKFHITPVQT